MLMDNTGDRIIVRNVAISPTPAPVSLPDGKERIPLGSGVITRLLGQGGMAAVYEIWNAQLEMYRAVKLLHPGSAETVHQRFQTEIKISAKLRHPNIVEIHGVGEWNGLPYIEMEKIDGIGLDTLIHRRGALPPVVCTAVGIMICHALDYAHNQDCSIYGRNYHGVIHRDLKPGNIMICSSGIVKLMDFGIARPAEVSFHTMDGLVAGTFQYLAPEQLEKKKLDVTTDLYALGVTFYEIVTGVVAFPQTSFPKLIADKTKNKFKPLEEFHIKLPPRLRRVIYKCMAEEPSRRVPCAAALLDELHKIHRSLTGKSPEQVMAAFTEQGTGKRVVLLTRRRFPWRLAAIAAVAASVAAAAFLFVWPYYIRSLDKKTAHSAAAAPRPQPVAEQPPAVATAALAAAERKGQPRQKKHGIPVKTRAQPPPEKPPVPQPARQVPLIESMKEKYGTDDVLVIMEKELKQKNNANVLALFESIPKDSRTPRALILKMRALEGSGSPARLSQFLESTTINDGEFMLQKARIAFKNREYEECKKLLSQSLKLPHAYIDYEILKQEVYYCSALCVTAQFDANPAEQTYRAALDSWWKLRTELRANPGHEYNKIAVTELQRMGKKMEKE
jgi:hypothetical protein